MPMLTKNNLFNFMPHSVYPNIYEVCQNTGVYRYLPARTRKYSESYFLQEYKEQYQKTYYQDEKNLRRLAKRRLYELTKYTVLRGKTLLEIGCAAGFFLDEAWKMGLDVRGLELSATESQYASQELGLTVETLSFLDYQSEGSFDILAAFFVLEHMDRQEEALCKIAQLVKPGGYLLLSLPSLAGPSYLGRRDQWFANHPEDHFYDYHPVSIKKTLAYFGMQTFYLRPMSYHQNRDRGWRRGLPLPFYKKLANYSCYGDTMQIIAKKTQRNGQDP